MVLSIKSNFCYDTEGFCKFLKKRIRKEAVKSSNWDPARVKVWNNYLAELDGISWPTDPSGRPVFATFAIIVNSFFSNLDYIECDDRFLIRCDPDACIGITSLHVEPFARLINFGTMDTPAYPYFSNVFKYFENHLKDYYRLYTGNI